MYNVYQFKALDTFVVDAIQMQEQLDNTVTNSSWSSSQKAERHIQGHTGMAMDLNSQLLQFDVLTKILTVIQEVPWCATCLRWGHSLCLPFTICAISP